VNSGANHAHLVRSHNWLIVLDTETYAVTANIAVGKHPSSVAFDGALRLRGAWVVDVQLAASAGRAGRLLLPDQNGAKVTVVDLQRRRGGPDRPVGNTPTFTAADGGTSYVANQFRKSVSLFPI
jgi:YVTN family beta-propeller protein